MWRSFIPNHAISKYNRSTEQCSRLKLPESRQVRYRLVKTSEHIQAQKWEWDRTRKRPLFAYRTRCNCYMKTERNKVESHIL